MNTISCYATPKELLDFCVHNTDVYFTHLRYAQVDFLYHFLRLQRKEISQITGYAPSTLSTMRNKVRQYDELAQRVFETLAAPVIEEITKKDTRRCGNVSVDINYLPNCGTDMEQAQQAYLFKFYTDDRSIPVFTKIGTTAVSVNKRIRQEIGEYRKKGFNILSVDVCKIINCGNIPAESYESYLRALLIKEFPGTWHKNDRFFGVDIPTERFESLCSIFSTL